MLENFVVGDQEFLGRLGTTLWIMLCALGIFYMVRLCGLDSYMILLFIVQLVLEYFLFTRLNEVNVHHKIHR